MVHEAKPIANKDKHANKLNNESYFNPSIAGQNDYIAFFDKSDAQRVDFLRKFALQGEIDFITDTIADVTIIYDENGYFAYPDVKQLAARLKPEKGKYIIDEINEAYRQVYNSFNFNIPISYYKLIISQNFKNGKVYGIFCLTTALFPFKTKTTRMGGEDS